MRRVSSRQGEGWSQGADSDFGLHRGKPVSVLYCIDGYLGTRIVKLNL